VTGTYTFGDSSPARKRLDLLAELFAPGTDALLDRWAPERPGVALDLGCGPGNTSLALARACRPDRLVAVDASPAMVAATAARLAGVPGAEAVVADVTGPLPGAPADLVHARYLVAHLPDPLRVVEGWVGQLRPGGRLLLDEIDHIDTTAEPFRRYLDTVTAMLAAHGTDLYAGAVLAGWCPPGASVVGEVALALPQPTAAVARMFGLNLSEWRRGAWAAANLPAAELDDLAEALASLAAAGGDRVDEITWTHRQLAFSPAS
jgi:trans-aconitate 2-methyltransferase